MAHKDACKYQVQQFMKKLVREGMTITAASAQTEKESDGIPSETCRRWWYEVQQETEAVFKNEQTESPQLTPSTDSEIQENNPITTDIIPTNSRPLCACGSPCERGRKKVDGTQTYLSVCSKCRKQNTKQTSNALAFLREEASTALDKAEAAISMLQSIQDNDPKKDQAFKYVCRWIKKQIKERKGN